MVNVIQSTNKLFVRNLPFTCTDEKLEELFSNDGPLKRCFVVKQNDKQLCRGFGFVTFALREDAQKVLESDKWLEGKKIHIEYANSKTPDKKKGQKDREKGGEKEQHGDDKEKVTEVVKGQKRKHQDKPDQEGHPAKKQFASHRCNGSSKLEISNIPTKVNQKNIKKFFEKFGKVRYCNLIRNKNRRSIGKAFINFEDEFAAEECLRSARNKEDPLVMSGSQLTVVPALAPVVIEGGVSGQTDLSPEDQEGRIVIRNLSFQCSIEDIKDEFGQFGEIMNLAMPMNNERKTHKGFVFLQYQSKDEASNAVKRMNGKQLNDRPIAVDFALPRDRYQKAKQSPQPTENKTKKGVTSEDGGDSSTDEEQHENDDDSSEEDDDDDENSVDEEDDSSEKDGGDETDDDSDGEKDDDQEGAGSESDESDEEMEEESPKRHSSDVEKGTTVFVRNLPYEVTEGELRKVFMKYGSVKSCHLVLDPVTDHPRGSGFVQFVKKEQAERCLQEASPEGSPPELHGRVLTVVKALSREQSADIREKRKKIIRMEEKDPRNTYLLREGFVRPGTQAAVGLSQADLAKRTKIEGVKRAKLKNIYIFVSKTRLVVHNLPKSVDDKKLKEIFRSGVKAKAGVHITEAKVMLDKTSVDAEGKRSSLGYGFVSFKDHSHALEALRTINNNPSLFGNSRRLIVGFSLENKKALEKKQRQIEKSKMKQGHLKTVKTGKKESEKVSKNIDVDTDPRVDIPANARKGLPKHAHAKLRWRDRGKKEREMRKQKLDRRKKLFQQQAGRKQSQANVEIVGEKTKFTNEKEPKRRRRGQKIEKEDRKFESLVAQYKKKISQSVGGSKWFE